MSQYAAFNDLVNTTLAHYKDEAMFDVSEYNGLRRWMQENKNVTTYNGGTEVRMIAVFAENTSLQNYSGSSVMNAGASRVADQLFYDWVQKAIFIESNGKELRLNAGDAQLIDLAKAKVKQMRETIENRMNMEYYSDGSIPGGFKGLPTMFTANGMGVVGGLDSALVPKWRNAWADVGAPGTMNAANIRQYYNKFWRLVDRGGSEKPDLTIVSMDIYTMLEDALITGHRYDYPYQSKKSADFGFDAIKYKGADIINDINVSFNSMAEKAWFVNSRKVFEFHHQEGKWEPEMVAAPYNQDIKVTRALFMGGIGAMSRRSSGVMYTS